eukprot:CAMPEP_0179208536 /NCGR_PEP_ID=MMETSP0796-20121207/103999_1 /TAXON_ID=73915 /ORGANISM="Pyrodinium bahamense, Strain pbaha01" /LENGTH=66 /DNA_ID=CAMNT_0020913487 /DNA_START=1 /DNA_END=201 /DNA_ORIENTATION=+
MNPFSLLEHLPELVHLRLEVRDASLSTLRRAEALYVLLVRHILASVRKGEGVERLLVVLDSGMHRG